MPDVFFDSQESLPEGIREHAAKDEATGKFKVNLVLNSTLKEFRDNNTNLLKERDTLKDRVSQYSSIVGDDVTTFQSELQELRQTAQLVKDGKLSTKDDIAREVAARVKSMEEGFQGQLKEAGTKLQSAMDRGNKYEGLFKQSVRHREITNAVLHKDSGANPEALPDILSRADRIFVVDDNGNLIPKNGDTTIYGADGVSPMSPKEWLGKLLEESPYLGKASAGGGAAGGNGKASQYGGMTEAQFNALPPARRIELARQQKRA